MKKFCPPAGRQARKAHNARLKRASGNWMAKLQFFMKQQAAYLYF